MWLLTLLGLLGTLLSFIFLTLSIASGLYYLSELVEEHTRLTSLLLRRLIYFIIITLALLWLFDGFPFLLTISGVLSHLLYLGNLRYFPFVKISSPVFLGSVVAVGLQHWLWFRHFSSASARRNADPYGIGRNTASIPPSFTEVASFFGICVWLVPFALFVSLSASENVLPSMGSEYATGEHRPSAAGIDGASAVGGGVTMGINDDPSGKRKSKSVGLVKVGIDKARDWVAETGGALGLWRHDSVRSTF